MQRVQVLIDVMSSIGPWVDGLPSLHGHGASGTQLCMGLVSITLLRQHTQLNSLSQHLGLVNPKIGKWRSKKTCIPARYMNIHSYPIHIPLTYHIWTIHWSITIPLPSYSPPVALPVFVQVIKVPRSPLQTAWFTRCQSSSCHLATSASRGHSSPPAHVGKMMINHWLYP